MEAICDDFGGEHFDEPNNDNVADGDDDDDDGPVPEEHSKKEILAAINVLKNSIFIKGFEDCLDPVRQIENRFQNSFLSTAFERDIRTYFA